MGGSQAGDKKLKTGKEQFVIDLSQVSANDVALVGGKGASLGELLRNLTPLGVRAVEGFAITSSAYRTLLETEALGRRLRDLLADLDPDDIKMLNAVGREARALMLDTPLPATIKDSVI